MYNSNWVKLRQMKKKTTTLSTGLWFWYSLLFVHRISKFRYNENCAQDIFIHEWGWLFPKLRFFGQIILSLFNFGILFDLSAHCVIIIRRHQLTWCVEYFFVKYKIAFVLMLSFMLLQLKRMRGAWLHTWKSLISTFFLISLFEGGRDIKRDWKQIFRPHAVDQRNRNKPNGGPLSDIAMGFVFNLLLVFVYFRAWNPFGQSLCSLLISLFISLFLFELMRIDEGGTHTHSLDVGVSGCADDALISCLWIFTHFVAAR